MVPAILVLLLYAYTGVTAPISDNPEDPGQEHPTHEKIWLSAPTRRGTLDVLFTCILTLLLCVWTTIHSNIEPEVWDQDAAASGIIVKLSAFNKWKIFWSLVTLLFPEIALLVAAHERKTAILLKKEMKLKTNHPNDQKDGQKYEYRQFWDLTLSYYAVMGGFVVRPRTRTDNPGFEKVEDDSTLTVEEREKLKTHHTLTPRGVLFLAGKSLLPYYSPSTVKDKSKASVLAKFLVCFQAVWIIIQVIGRYGAGLPVTLLELYTVLHTLCAVVMYAIWIDKPLDVTEPTFIYLSPDVLHDLLDDKPDPANGMSKGDNPTKIFWHRDEEHDDYIHYLTRRAGLGVLLFRQLWDFHKFKDSESLIKKFFLLLRAYNALWNGWKTFWWETSTLSMIGVIHGGLHLVAWSFLFPTELERILWKTASLITAGSVAAFCLSVLAGFFGKSLWEKARKKYETTVNELGNLHRNRGNLNPKPWQEKLYLYTVTWKDWKDYWLWWCLTTYCTFFVLALVPCVLARLYLLVESFAAMRELPYHSYDRVTWSTFLPHFG